MYLGYSRMACRMILIWGFWVAPEGNVFLLEGWQSAALKFWIAKLAGLWASSLRMEV